MTMDLPATTNVIAISLAVPQVLVQLIIRVGITAPA